MHFLILTWPRSQKPPNPKLVKHFIDTIVRRIKPHVKGKEVPSLTTIQGIYYEVTSYFYFAHPQFSKPWTQHWVARTRAFFNHLASSKRVVKGRWYKQQWVRFKVAERINQHWVSHALEQGTISSDGIWQALATLVIQSATCARIGDVLRSKCYEGQEYLTWPCIRWHFYLAQPIINNLHCKITLQYCKVSNSFTPINRFLCH